MWCCCCCCAGYCISLFQCLTRVMFSIIHVYGVCNVHTTVERVDFRSEPHHTVHMHKINKVTSQTTTAEAAASAAVDNIFSEIWKRIRGPVTIYNMMRHYNQITSCTMCVDATQHSINVYCNQQNMSAYGNITWESCDE